MNLWTSAMGLHTKSSGEELTLRDISGRKMETQLRAPLGHVSRRHAHALSSNPVFPRLFFLPSSY